MLMNVIRMEMNSQKSLKNVFDDGAVLSLNRINYTVYNDIRTI